MDNDVFVAISLINYFLQKWLNSVNMFLSFVHLPETVADLMLQQLRFLLVSETPNNSINSFWLFESLDTEQTVNSVSDGRRGVTQDIFVML
jgi:hypothetical protein